MSQLDLNTVDIDGAIRDSAEDAGLDRAAFFKKAGVVGAGAVAGASMFGPFLGNAEAAIRSRRSKKNDIRILNYALTLEYLEAEFYKQALANNAFSSPEYRLFGETVSRHETTHVNFLKKALGSKAIKKPTFDFKDTVTDPAKFAATAQVLEDTGVRAYAGQGPNILQKPVAPTAARIFFSLSFASKLTGAGWIERRAPGAPPPLRKRIHAAWRASTEWIARAAARMSGLSMFAACPR